MTTKNKILISSAVTLAASLVMAKPAFAETCTTQYGGQYGSTTTCVSENVFINKKVADPTQTNVYVENLFSDKAFSPEQTVVYQITVTNSSNQDYNQVTVTDTLPNEVVFQAGPGTINGRVLTFTLTNLKAGQSQTEYVVAKVKEAKDLPKLDMNCDVKNEAKVTINNTTNTDTSTICVQTKVLGASTLPVAGFNDLLMVVPFATSGLAGLLLLKKKKA